MSLPSASPITPGYALPAQQTITGWETITRSPVSASEITIKYFPAATGFSAQQETFTIPTLELDLLPGLTESIVPGTLRFTLGGVLYSDRIGQGLLYLEDGTVAGSIAYNTGIATITQRPASFSLNITSMVTTFGESVTDNYFFRTPGSPLQPGGLIINATDLDGNLITEQGDFTGYIDTAGTQGFIDYEMGVAQIHYGQIIADASLTDEQKSEPWYDPANVADDGNIWMPNYVYPSTVRFSCVVYTHLPLDADVLGLDPVRLPSDGRVPIVRAGDVMVIHQDETYTLPNPTAAGDTVNLPHSFITSPIIYDANESKVAQHKTEASEDMPSPLSAAQAIQLAAGDLATCVLYDALDAIVPPEHYSVDLPSGAVTMSDPLDLSAYTEPLTAVYVSANYTADRKLGAVTFYDSADLSGYTQPLEARYKLESMQLIRDVQINGTVTASAPSPHDFDATRAYASTALILGDLTARVTSFFHQSTWTGVWDDSRIGDDTTAKFNATSYPIAVRNDAAIKQRWLIKFTSSTTFVVIGETVGQIATGNITADLAPINPLTELPYFSINSGGWGSGWSTGNCVRFNTVAASAPVWASRCVVSGEATNDEDSFSVQVRGDAD